MPEHRHDTRETRGAVTRAELRSITARVAAVERQLEIEREIITTIARADPRTAASILETLLYRVQALDDAGEHEKAAAMARVIEEITA